MYSVHNKNSSFKNKIIAVTGAASGIGAAICRKFGQAGAKIAMLDMDIKKLKSFEKELNNSGITTLSRQCDVSLMDECTASIKYIIKKFGAIDILFNNAGITQRSSFIDTEIPVFYKVMDVNFFGSLYCTKAAINSIIQRKGAVVVISSIAGIGPLLGRSGYCASKHALNGLFSTLRTELKGKGVHIMIVCPGFTKTNLQSRALDSDGSVTDHPQSRIGSQLEPESVADSIYKGLLKRKRLMVLSPAGKAAYYLNRFFPHIYERIIEKKFKSELAR